MKFFFFIYPILSYWIPTHIFTSTDLYIRKSNSAIVPIYPAPQKSVNDIRTIRYLAEMSYDAYIKINSSDWYNFNNTSDIRSSIKGYIFWHDNRYIVALKGTSLTISNDRYNDNMFFSCCYYKQSNLFKDACDIVTPDHVCSKTCYEKPTFNYLSVLDTLKFKVTDDVIFTGHSLGGMLATYLAIKYDKPAVTFETPGTKHYLDAISLTYTHAVDKIFHFGHTADPIFMGRCNLRTSLCYIAGYVLRTKCHVGNTCIYDDNTRPSILKHRMSYIINTLIPQWETNFPECKIDTSCRDCEQWKFV